MSYQQIAYKCEVDVVAVVTNSMEQNLFFFEQITIAQVVKECLAFVKPGAISRTHKSPPLVPVLRQTNLADTSISYFFKIYFNSFMRSSPSFSFSF